MMFSSLLTTCSGCKDDTQHNSKTAKESTESAQNYSNDSMSNDEYTDKSGGNEYSDQSDVTDRQNMQEAEFPDNAVNAINVKIIGYIIIIDNHEFEDVNESVDYIYSLKKEQNLPIIINLKYSKAKVSVPFMLDLDKRGIFYKIGES